MNKIILFAAKLNTILEKRKLTTPELAMCLGLANKSVTNKWSNAKNMPSAEVLADLVRFLVIPADWFIDTKDTIYDAAIVEKLEHEIIASESEYTFNLNNSYTIEQRTEIIFCINILNQIKLNTGTKKKVFKNYSELETIAKLERLTNHQNEIIDFSDLDMLIEKHINKLLEPKTEDTQPTIFDD